MSQTKTCKGPCGITRPVDLFPIEVLVNGKVRKRSEFCRSCYAKRDDMPSRNCSRCKVRKSRNAFGLEPNGSGHKDGTCLACRAALA